VRKHSSRKALSENGMAGGGASKLGRFEIDVTKTMKLM